MPIFDGMGNYVETAVERDTRMKLEISYQHTRDEKPYEVLTGIPVPDVNSFFLGASIRPSVLNNGLDNLGSLGDTSVLFSEGSVFQTEVPLAQSLSAPGEYKIDYSSGQVRTYTTPSGIGTVAFAWSPFPYYILPEWHEFSDPLCMHVCPQCAHGNVSTLVTGAGVGFASSPFYGGTHPPIFVYTGFPVSCALVAFEKEYDQHDVDYIYYYQTIARAASIRVGAVTDIGFYVEFKQIEDAPWVLEFNWIATGCKRATPDDPCECCEGSSVPPQNALIDQFDGKLIITGSILDQFDGRCDITHAIFDQFDGRIHIASAGSCDQFDGCIAICVAYCCIVYDSDYWFNRMCPLSPKALPGPATASLLQKVRDLSAYFNSINLTDRNDAAQLLRNAHGDTNLDKLQRFYLTNLLNVAVGALPLDTVVDSVHSSATTFAGVITDVDNVLLNYSGNNVEVTRALELVIDITLRDATICLKINEESWCDEGDIDAPGQPCDDDSSSSSSSSCSSSSSSSSSDSSDDCNPCINIDPSLAAQGVAQGIRRLVLRVFHEYKSGPYITTIEGFRGSSTSLNRRIDIEAGTAVPSGAVDVNPGGRSGNIAILYTQLDQILFDVTATPEPNGRGKLPTNTTLRVKVKDSGGEHVYGPIVIHTSGSQPLSIGMKFGPLEIVEIDKIL